MTVPTSNFRAGRTMVRQDRMTIENRISSADTTGKRMLQGKNFDCTRGLGRVTTSDCLARYSAHLEPCRESERGPCSHGHVAEQRAAGRL